MTGAIVIRGGTVFDGTGTPGRRADVAIADGVIRAIGENLHGEDALELDASGCAVAPGFIDIHTHYDAQVFWDPALRPSSLPRRHDGGGGQLRLLDRADARPSDRDADRRTLKNVEDMNPATLMAGIPWEFETFPDYLRLVDRRGTIDQLHRVYRSLARCASA